MSSQGQLQVAGAHSDASLGRRTPGGPRGSTNRSISPAPPVLPLNISRRSNPSPAPTPSRRPRLALNTVSNDSNANFTHYYGNEAIEDTRPQPNATHEDTTIRPQKPALTLKQTTSGPVNNMLDVNRANNSTPDHFPPDHWSDDVIEEVQRLGEGAGGAVHKVRDRRDGKIMARKTITTREVPPQQLQRELQFMANSVHENIIRFYGAYISPSSSEVKVLMELGEGGSLETVGKRIKERGGVVGERPAASLAEGIMQGLAYLHSQKIIHRDIKPSNILLSREGVVKLCDFGVSGELVGSEAATFTGTGFYMAPERISGEPYTIRSDVWSTGISLLELAENRFPFPVDLGPIDLMLHITRNEPPSLDDGGDWSESMRDFIRQTLIVDPHSRPTPKDMLAHPWIVENMKPKAPMAIWMADIWGWPRPPKKHKDSASRPGSRAAVDNSPASESSPSANSAS